MMMTRADTENKIKRSFVKKITEIIIENNFTSVFMVNLYSYSQSMPKSIVTKRAHFTVDSAREQNRLFSNIRVLSKNENTCIKNRFTTRLKNYCRYVKLCNTACLLSVGGVYVVSTIREKLEKIWEESEVLVYYTRVDF